MRRMYSENQLVNVLENKDVVAKTLKQTQANYSLDLSSFTPDNIPSGITYTLVYGRIEEINGILYIVWLFSLENTTESSITHANCGIDITLDEEIAEKIIDISGVSVAENTSTKDISAFHGFKSDDSYPHNLNRYSYNCCLSNRSTANKFRINLYFNGQTIGAGKKQYCEMRTFLTIL